VLDDLHIIVSSVERDDMRPSDYGKEEGPEPHFTDEEKAIMQADEEALPKQLDDTAKSGEGNQ
jgi:hypothetical protein